LIHFQAGQGKWDVDEVIHGVTLIHVLTTKGHWSAVIKDRDPHWEQTDIVADYYQKTSQDNVLASMMQVQAMPDEEKELFLQSNAINLSSKKSKHSDRVATSPKRASERLYGDAPPARKAVRDIRSDDEDGAPPEQEEGLTPNSKRLKLLKQKSIALESAARNNDYKSLLNCSFQNLLEDEGGSLAESDKINAPKKKATKPP
jgi:hypothetical protein